KSDDYLKNRREAVSKAMQKKTMKEESSEEETEVEQIDEVTMKEKQKPQKPTTVPKPTMPSPKMLPKRPIQPTTVPMPDRMKGIPSDLDDYRKNKQLRASTVDPKKLADTAKSVREQIALTDKEKIDILNDKISELENYILELETAMGNNEIHESQIAFVNNILLEGKGSINVLKSLLQEINLNAII
ncbi:MAG: hypothetical protein EBW12_06745, partial [Actinobacteria bacterium]|nr:hypothetical protein [Actinomycetota bacterium]